MKIKIYFSSSLMNMQIDPNLKLSFEQANDEHRIISRYTSRLANYYQNNRLDDTQSRNSSSYLPGYQTINNSNLNNYQQQILTNKNYNVINFFYVKLNSKLLYNLDS